MFIFLRLLLAHFIGDFPLQFDAIYKLKLKGFAGNLPHALLITACSAAAMWPWLRLPSVWLFVLFIGVTHLLEDYLKIKTGRGGCGFLSYVTDQLIHVAVISAVWLTPLARLGPLPGPPVVHQCLFVQLYADDVLVVFVICLIAASYNGHYMIRCFKDSFMERAEYSNFEKWFGKIERGAVVTGFFLGGGFLLAVPAIFGLRPLAFGLFGRRLTLPRSFVSPKEIFLSWTVAILTGLVLLLFKTNYPVD